VLRYALAQVPGWIGLAIALLVARIWIDWPPWVAVAAAALWLAKDLIGYRIARHAFEATPANASSRLVGARCTAVRTLDPEGWVRLGGELWRAEIEPGSGPVAPGTTLRIAEVRGLVLRVEPWQESRPT
jgi:membrane-bound serine protease (ClpP class)